MDQILRYVIVVLVDRLVQVINGRIGQRSADHNAHVERPNGGEVLPVPPRYVLGLDGNTLRHGLAHLRHRFALGYVFHGRPPSAGYRRRYGEASVAQAGCGFVVIVFCNMDYTTAPACRLLPHGLFVATARTAERNFVLNLEFGCTSTSSIIGHCACNSLVIAWCVYGTAISGKEIICILIAFVPFRLLFGTLKVDSSGRHSRCLERYSGPVQRILDQFRQR
mmetsp:Transcript_3076/g.6671  ORF Transcript_3076/g.6671 Transcript_3076/m.6671 type:complete len:222 (+) Transcript_3076:157-822(+)